jgi:hypothetical protein
MRVIRAPCFGSWKRGAVREVYSIPWGKSMLKRLLLVLGLCSAFAAYLYPQGLQTNATKNDWEEINFEFDSSVLVDGYPSLLRLAELLQQNSGHRITLEGHTDRIGSNQYNDRLSRRRAETVRDFLVKYGANANQIQIEGFGKNRPQAPGGSKEARFINRRVSMVLRDQAGNIVGPAQGGGVNDMIGELQKLAKAQQECCDAILKRLDRLDEILSAVRDLGQQHAALRKDVDDLRERQGVTDRRMTEVTEATARLPGQTEEAINRVFDANRPQRFQLMGINVGPDFTQGYRGNLTASAKGRYFAPFGQNRFALQAEGEYMYYRSRQEGQFDLGLVSRWGDMQLGGFTSFKHAYLREFRGGASMAQAGLATDFLFGWGRLGAFGTKAFMTDRIVQRTQLNPVTYQQTMLSVVDQLGVSGAVGLVGNTYLEGNFAGLFRKYASNTAGGMLRVVVPLGDSPFAFTAEASANETWVGRGGVNGRFVVGVQMGNFLRPREYRASGVPVPMDIPRVRFDVVTRTVREGNQPPVADAGADQFGLRAGVIQLDGRASHDPDGDPLTFEWRQIGGPAVTINNANEAQASFTAAEGQTYVFQLIVRDNQGAESRARVTVGTREADVSVARVLRFTASPVTIAPGEVTTLAWETENATTVSISGIGNVSAAGTATVSPTTTTTYTITAANQNGSVNQNVTVQVSQQGGPRILRFSSSPMEISAGGQTILNWDVEGATSVEISGIGTVSPTGTRAVNPTTTTTYTLTATGPGNQTVTSSIVVSVLSPVRILEFTADPTATTQPNTPVTLRWQTENATDIRITGIGPVGPEGTITVFPERATSYTLLASNGRQQVTAVVVVSRTPSVGTGVDDYEAPEANAGPSQVTTGDVVQLDASRSFSHTGLNLTYQWRLVGSTRLVQFDNPNSPTPTVTLVSGLGVYTFEVTVTDELGAKSTATTTVTKVLP